MRASSRYGYVDFMAYVVIVADEPKSYIEAVNSKERSQWLENMNDEMQSLYKNDTWRLVDKPRNQKILGCK